MASQLGHCVNYAPNCPGDPSDSTESYNKEYDRVRGVIDAVLKDREYLAGDYSIADMASFPWVLMYKRFDVNLDAFDNLRRWFDAIKNRPAVRKGIDLGKELRNPKANQSKESLKMMFGQTADSIKKAAEENK